MQMRRLLPLGLAGVWLAAAPGALIAQIAAQPHQLPAPPELPASVAAAIAPAGVHAMVGAVALDFWFVKSVPLKTGSTTAGWESVDEGTLVGALRVSAAFPDIRGRVIKPGLYTLRYGLQPSNGDHLGVSPFRDFLLLIPADLDTDTAPRGHDGTIDLSKRAIGGSHPAVLSIDPPSAASAPFSLHTTELGHHAVVVEAALSRGGTPAGTLRFGIVLVGHIDA
jgi:hypothetical protein